MIKESIFTLSYMTKIFFTIVFEVSYGSEEIFGLFDIPKQ